MARMTGKVALITGAGRGQGRSHAIRLAEEGADIIAADICMNLETVDYDMASKDDLAQTVKDVEALDRRILAVEADVRELAAMESVVAEGIERFGHIDAVVANAGIASFGLSWELEEKVWRELIDINLTGVWNTVRAATPEMVAAGRGGSIVLTSSSAGLVSIPNGAHYSASKGGVLSLSRAMAQELGPHGIRVNTVHPTSVDTVMIHNEATYARFAPGITEPTRADVEPIFSEQNAMPIPWVEAVDVSNAVLFLLSDEARYVTGCALTVDGGVTVKYPGT